LTPADAIDDLWTLVRAPIQTFRRFPPRGFVDWIERMNSDKFFSKAGWINPRVHPWRFAVALAMLVGIGLVLA
jgi:hypothetical protein